MARKHIQQAVKNLGGPSRARERLKTSRGTIYNWINQGYVPPERVLDVERASGVSRHDLNPKIYPREDAPRDSA